MITVRYSDDVVVNGIKMMVYGAAGVGKTPLCSTAPYPIILSAEHGLLSIRKTHTPYIEIRNYQQLQESYLWASQSQEARTNYWTICLDSLSEIAEVCLTEYLKRNKDPRKAYGEVLDNVIQLARAFRDLPGKNVVLVSKEEFAKDEGTGVILYQPLMPGSKLAPRLPYFFDILVRMVKAPAQDGRTVGVLCTQGNYQFVARDRSGTLAPYEQPNLNYVFRKIIGLAV